MSDRQDPERIDYLLSYLRDVVLNKDEWVKSPFHIRFRDEEK